MRTAESVLEPTPEFQDVPIATDSDVKRVTRGIRLECDADRILTFALANADASCAGGDIKATSIGGTQGDFGEALVR